MFQSVAYLTLMIAIFWLIFTPKLTLQDRK